MAYKFASTPSHSYLRTAFYNVPNWDATNWTTISLKVRTFGAVDWVGGLLGLTHAMGASGKVNNYDLQIENTGYNNRVRFWVNRNDTEFKIDSTFSWPHSDTSWHHVLAVANRDNNTMYLSVDGAAMQTKDSVKWPETEKWNIGLSATGAAWNGLNGAIAEVGIWDVPLLTIPGFGDRDVAALAAGTAPRLVRPDHLLAYWPLLGHSASEVGRYDFIEYNNPEPVEHCPVYRGFGPVMTVPFTPPPPEPGGSRGGPLAGVGMVAL